MVTADATIPNPARQVITAGGKPKVKQPAAAPNPVEEAPPDTPMHAAHAIGPDCTLVKQVMMTSISKNEADSFDIFCFGFYNFYGIYILCIYTYYEILITNTI